MKIATCMLNKNVPRALTALLIISAPRIRVAPEQQMMAISPTLHVC
jgi:hypothetical protein